MAESRTIRACCPSALAVAVLVALSQSVSAQESWDRPACVTGEVCDEHEAPVDGADVFLRSFVGPLLSNARRHSVFDSPLAAARTDSRGRFSLTLPEWTTLIDAPLAVVASAPGRSGPDCDRIHPFDRRSHKLRLRLPRLDPESSADYPRYGRLVDAAGRPLSGTRVVSLVRAPYASTIPLNGFFCINGYSDFVVGLDETTNANGWFRLPPFRSCTIVIVRRGDHAVPMEPRMGGGDIVVPDRYDRATGDSWIEACLRARGPELPDPDDVAAALQRRAGALGEIAGRVVGPDGRPVQGAEVTALPPVAVLDVVGSLRIAYQRPRGPFAQTDATGRFVVRHLGPGLYRLHVAAPHLVPRLSAPILLGKESKTLARALMLQPGASLTVRGTGAHPRIRGVDADDSVCFDGRGGVVVLDGLPPGLVRVWAWSGGCCGGPSRLVRIPKGGTAEVDFGTPEEEPPRERRVGNR